MSSIELHPELGLNPKIIKHQCPACGATSDGEIVLLGRHNHREQCVHCEAWVYGGMRRGDKCPKCGVARLRGGLREELSESDRYIQGRPEFCETCEGHSRLGVIFVCVSDTCEPSSPELLGPLCVLRDAAVTRIITDEAKRDSVLKSRMVYVPYSDWKLIGLPMGQGSEDEKNRE